MVVKNLGILIWIFISDVGESVLANKDKRAEELIQVQYFAALLRGTFI